MQQYFKITNYFGQSNKIHSTVEPTYKDPGLSVIAATFHCIYDFTTLPILTAPMCADSKRA